MTISILISVLAGMALGLRFNVLMNMPAIVVAGLSTAAIMIAQRESGGVILSAVALSAVGVQIGYLCGTFARFMKEAQVPMASSQTASSDVYREQSRIRIPAHATDQ